MLLILAFFMISLAGILSVPFLKPGGKGVVVVTVILLNAVITGYFAVYTLMGTSFSFSFPGSYITGVIPVRMDALSGWFILIINMVFITGGIYGTYYMRAYKSQVNNLTLHYISFILLYSSLIFLCVVQNSLAFLIGWEILALSAFLLIIFEHEKISTIKAGINYLIQAHFSIVFLMIGFMWVAHKTGSYDFKAITDYTAGLPGSASLMLFLLFFCAFAIKAGFLPFHTWLPYAHPAAPAHISGMMSGVIIKIGIFGILRMLLVIRTDYYTLGFIILFISVVSGLNGVMLAILQHNLKKLLAYHSIENIGIIGIGIGLGCIGFGSGNQVLATLGFAGALLHTLNHALFKSLLFYAAGNIYQSVHTLEIEHLGGLIKRMPQTAGLFLISAIAICGIPPFNGFISEFIIYSGLYNWMENGAMLSLLTAVFSMTALVLTGGLAMLCFTKAFGIVFLGSPRQKIPDSCKEAPFGQLLPLYLITLLIIIIGVFPQWFIRLLFYPVNLLTHADVPYGNLIRIRAFEALQPISLAILGLISLSLVLFGIRKMVLSRRSIARGPTWGCGYTNPSPKLQYTAGSFVRTYTKLFHVFLISGKEENELKGIFPSGGKYKTHPYDKAEKWLIDKPLKFNQSFMGRFVFLNNGKLQFYILYGIIFILSVLSFPLIYQNIFVFIDFLKNL
ncbi:MAG: proton-conducting transporter membrane subunit [Bacteroidota bacterium]